MIETSSHVRLSGLKPCRPVAALAGLSAWTLRADYDVAVNPTDVTLTARFANPSSDTLEGLFSFELPEGAVVTGYALDIEGDNAAIKSLCKGLGATLVFDEKSHVHVEFKNGIGG